MIYIKVRIVILEIENRYRVEIGFRLEEYLFLLEFSLSCLVIEL